MPIRRGPVGAAGPNAPRSAAHRRAEEQRAATGGRGQQRSGDGEQWQGAGGGRRAARLGSAQPGPEQRDSERLRRPRDGVLTARLQTIREAKSASDDPELKEALSSVSALRGEISADPNGAVRPPRGCGAAERLPRGGTAHEPRRSQRHGLLQPGVKAFYTAVTNTFSYDFHLLFATGAEISLQAVGWQIGNLQPLQARRAPLAAAYSPRVQQNGAPKEPL